MLRERYTGKAEFVVNFFEFIAEEVRELLAELGFRTPRRGDRPRRAARRRQRRSTTGRPPGSTSRRSCTCPSCPRAPSLHNTTGQDHGLDKALDNELVAAGRPTRSRTASRSARRSTIRNVNRTVGTILGHEVTKRYSGEGLPDGTIDITFTGSAGQSFGAFVPRGHHAAARGRRQRLRRQGALRRPDRGPPRPGRDVRRRASRSSPATSSRYGATSGEIFLRGQVGERFCVRNSGATAVVEGVGDHGCEYMTGGRVVVLGPTGRNFAAGMSGGVAFVLDLDEGRVNPELVELGPVDGEAADGAARRWCARHVEETGSTVAEALLDDWPAAADAGSPR